MNKNYLFVGIGVCVAVVILAITLSSSTMATMSLDKILEKKDCVALEKWGNNHLYDDDLNLSSEQQSEILKVGFECAGKALDNMFGNSNSTPDSLTELDEILEKNDCDGIKEWSKDNPGYGIGKGMTELKLNQIILLKSQCDIKN